jgi:hypothetical protein
MRHTGTNVGIFVISMILLASAASAQDSKPAPAKPDAAPAGIEAKKSGDTFKVGALSVTVKEMTFLPVVENDYSKRFLYDTFDNPKLKALRESEKLADVVAAGKTEFDKQLLLMHWDYKRFKKFGTPTVKAGGALEVLKAVDDGQTFFCAHYASVFVSAAASLGWVDRSVGLRLCEPNHCLGKRGQGYTEHSTTEIWSNQYGKWVMFDPTFDVYVQKAGVPLNAWEIRQAWFYGDANSLDFVVGEGGKHYKLSDLPLRLPHPGSTGNFPLEARTFDVYGHLFFETSTCPMDAPSEAKDRPAFIVKDALCDGVKWHTRDNPKDPAHEPYFPLGQAALKLEPIAGAENLALQVDTMTPNFFNYHVRIDGERWMDALAGPSIPRASAVASAGETAKRGPRHEGTWALHAGTNTLEFVAVNKFGVEGTPSKVVLEVAK